MPEQAEFNQRFQSQATKLGLGHGSFSNNPTPDERRKQVSRAYAIAAEEERIAHATTLSRQGNWTTFKDGVRCFDLSWKQPYLRPWPKGDIICAQCPNQLGKDARHAQVVGLQAVGIMPPL